LIIDDIAFWEWSAIAPTLEIERFVRAVRASCRKSDAALVVLYHTLSATDPPASDVHRLLLETCTTHIDCRPLVSGRSGAVSGEMITRRGPSSWGTEPPQLLQYRLTDASAVFFQKGAATGVI